MVNQPNVRQNDKNGITEDDARKEKDRKNKPNVSSTNKVRTTCSPNKLTKVQ